MEHPVVENFLKVAAEERDWAIAESDILHLVGEERSEGSPRLYFGTFRGIEHFERGPGGSVRTSDEPIGFSIYFPPDYLRNTDPDLQFRVARVESLPPLYHPNLRRSLICLGTGFTCGTRLRGLLQQLYGIFSYQIVATESPFNIEAGEYFLSRPEELAALRPAPPLWRRTVAEVASVESLAPAPEVS